MTKVINKKALLVLLTLVLAFCWLAVPVSAAEVGDELTYYSTESVESILVSTDEEMAARSITNNLLYELDIYAAKKVKGTANQYETYTIGNDGKPLHTEGPSVILNYYLPDGYYQTMLNNNLDYYWCVLTFDVRGTNLTRYKVETDEGVVLENSVVPSGNTYRVQFPCPRRDTATFSLIVYDNKGTSSASWGHIYRFK